MPDDERTAAGKIRRVCYLDAALVGNLGHHANVCRHIAGELRRRGISVDVLANASIESGLIDELNAIPVFRHNPYAKITRRKALNFRLAQASFVADLSDATPDRRYDLIYASSVLPAQMAAVIQWGQRRFSADDMPPIAFELGLPSGVGEDIAQTWAHYAEYYRVAAAGISEDHSGKILLFAFDAAASEDFRRLLGIEVATLPAVYAGGEIRRRKGDEQGRPVVGFLGHQRLDKGYYLIPDVLRLLLQKDVRARFLIHNGDAHETAVAGKLRQLAAIDSRICFDQQTADKTYWDRLLDMTDICALPYDPARYAAGVSAVAVEAVSCGLPIVSPAGTTMSALAERYQNNSITIAAWNAESIADAISEAVQAFPQLAESAFEGAGRWAVENSAQAFVSPLLDFANRHAAARPSPPARTADRLVRFLASVARVKMKRRGL